MQTFRPAGAEEIGRKFIFYRAFVPPAHFFEIKME
jgi:hypothetical protein